MMGQRLNAKASLEGQLSLAPLVHSSLPTQPFATQPSFYPWQAFLHPLADRQVISGAD